jgi:hypothetical protein
MSHASVFLGFTRREKMSRPARKVIVILTKNRLFPAGKVQVAVAQITIYVVDTVT